MAAVAAYTTDNVRTEGILYLAGHDADSAVIDYNYVRSDHPAMRMMEMRLGGPHSWPPAPIRTLIQPEVWWYIVPKDVFDACIESLLNLTTVINRSHAHLGCRCRTCTIRA